MAVGEYQVGQVVADPNATFAQRYTFAFRRLCQQGMAALGRAVIGVGRLLDMAVELQP